MDKANKTCKHCQKRIKRDACLNGSWIHVSTDRYGCRDSNGEYTGSFAAPGRKRKAVQP